MALMHVFIGPDGRLSAVIPKPVPHPTGDGPMFAGISPVGSAEGYEGFEIDLDPKLLIESEHPGEKLTSRSGVSPVEHIEQLVREQRDILPRAYLLSGDGPSGHPAV